MNEPAAAPRRMFTASNNNRRRAIYEIRQQIAKARENGDYQTADVLSLAEKLIRGEKISRNTHRLVSFLAK